MSRHRQHKQRAADIMIIVLVAVIFLCMGGIIYSIYQTGKRQNVTIGSQSTTGAYRHKQVDGVNYEFNNRITTILYVGIDSEGLMQTNGAYAQAPRSDTMMLMVLDEYNHTMTVIAFNRNTMTDIQQYDLAGNPIEKVELQLAFAFAEGDGGKVSSETSAQAITDLLEGIPIDYYIVMNRSAIPYFNDLAGDVKVTVPNNDLASVNPDFYEGNTVTLDGAQAEEFIRYRDTAEYFSNSGRMERQKAYVTAYMDTIKDSLLTDANGTWTKIDNSGMIDYMITNITKNQYIGLMNSISNVDVGGMNYYIPDGENDNTEMLERFYIDEDSLNRHVLDIFYLEE